jgi:ATP-dependent Clp protease, protease subunit
METQTPSWLNILPDGTPEAWIYQEIGAWGISAQAFVDAMRPYRGKAVKVRLNCYGGNVLDGIAIHTFLKECDATIYVDGIAASMASVVLMAGKKRIIGDNAFVMIHSPSGDAWGLTADEMRDSADMLDKLKASLLSAYVSTTGQSEKTVEKWMEGDTWFSAQECLEHGIATEITEGMRYAAMLGKLKNPPKALFDQLSNYRTSKDMAEAAETENKSLLEKIKALLTPTPEAAKAPEAKADATPPDVYGERIAAIEKRIGELSTGIETMLGAVAKAKDVSDIGTKVGTLEADVAKLTEDATARIDAAASAKALTIAAGQGVPPVSGAPAKAVAKSFADRFAANKK